jgi:hypothetical protein
VDDEYVETWPTATRIVTGADGEGADRSISVHTDSTQEDEWGGLVERFLDRRDLDSTDSTFQQEVTANATAELTERRGGEALMITVPVESLRFGVDYQVGDLLRAYPASAQIDARVVEAALTVRRDEAAKVALTLGVVNGGETSFGQRIRRLERV